MASTATATKKTAPANGRKKATAAKPAKKQAAAAPARDAAIKTEVENLARQIFAGNGEAINKLLDANAAAIANLRRLGEHVYYSPANCARILAADSGRDYAFRFVVLAKGGWERNGRTVREGAEPVWLYGPKFARRIAGAVPAQQQAQPAAATQPPAAPAAGQGGQQPDEPRERYATGFRLYEAYDIVDTVANDEDNPGPDLLTPLGAGDITTRDQLVRTSAARVTFADLSATVEGYRVTRDLITIDENTRIGNQIHTLVLANARWHLENPDEPTEQRTTRKPKVELRREIEQQTALAGWLAMKMLGLDEEVGNDVKGATIAYLTNRVNLEGKELAGHNSVFSLLQARMAPAHKAAAKVLDAYLPQENDETETAAA